MATVPLKGQMNKFLTPSSDEVPTLNAYDVNTPQAAREGLPLRLFDKSRARYNQGDVVNEDTKNYNQALNIFHLMSRENKTPQEIKSRIGENMYNKIIMNKKNVRQAATGGVVPTDPLLDPRFSRYYEEPEYRAYAHGGRVGLAEGNTPFMAWLSQVKNVNINTLGADEYSAYAQEWQRLQNKKAEGGEVEGPMEIPELTPEQETNLDMQMEEAIPPMEEGEMDVSAQVDTSVLDSDEEALLEEVIEMHPGIVDVIVKLTTKEFTGQGEVDGPGTGISDDIPAMLSDGEFVFTAKATKQLGVDKLRKQMKTAEDEYDNSMAVQDSQQIEYEQPMMYKGGLMSVNKYKI
jgi:hypothetical protein